MEIFYVAFFSLIIAGAIYYGMTNPVFTYNEEYTGVVVNRNVNNAEDLYELSVRLNIGSIPIIQDRTFFMKAPNNVEFTVIYTSRYNLFGNFIDDSYSVKEDRTIWID